MCWRQILRPRDVHLMVIGHDARHCLQENEEVMVKYAARIAQLDAELAASHVQSVDA